MAPSIVKLRHTRLAISDPHSVDDVWLIARLNHSPLVNGLILILQAFNDNDSPIIENTINAVLHQAGYASMGVDLLSVTEKDNADARLNISNMGKHLLAALDWVHHQPNLTHMPLGIIALDTATAAAARVAALHPERVPALALLSGRLDLAGVGLLRSLKTPIRVIVGTDDPRINIVRQAFGLITCESDWQTTEGGEPASMGTAMLTEASKLALAWLQPRMPPNPETQTGIFPTLAAALSFSDRTEPADEQ